MSLRVPDDHTLRRLFRSAIDEAFLRQSELYSPEVADHLADEILCDFVHVDRIYRLKDLAGRRLDELHEMIPVTRESEGPERRLEVDRYIGDFALFMGGFFPASLHQSFRALPLVSRVGGILVSFSDPADYYRAEGRNAYSRAAETARLFDPDSRHTYTQLADRFEGYQGILGEVKRILWERPEMQDFEGVLE